MAEGYHVAFAYGPDDRYGTDQRLALIRDPDTNEVVEDFDRAVEIAKRLLTSGRGDGPITVQELLVNRVATVSLSVDIEIDG